MPNRNIQSSLTYRYAYQGQEKGPETGKEAFELRLWYGRIGRWLTTDPYGEFSSPYLGMGNNPVSVIDVDGGRIIITHNGSSYEYKNHKLTNIKTGKEYSGNNSFLTGILGALKTLDYGYNHSNMSLSKDGKSLITNSFINSLVNSKDRYYITKSTKNKNYTNHTRLYMDPSLVDKTPTENGVIVSPFYITLIHEIGHAFLNMNKLADGTPWFTYTDEDSGKEKTKNYSEAQASTFENIFRAQHKLPLRTFYADGVPETNLFKMIRILNPNTRQREKVRHQRKIMNPRTWKLETRYD